MEQSCGSIYFFNSYSNTPYKTLHIDQKMSSLLFAFSVYGGLYERDDFKEKFQHLEDEGLLEPYDTLTTLLDNQDCLAVKIEFHDHNCQAGKLFPKKRTEPTAQ